MNVKLQPKKAAIKAATKKKSCNKKAATKKAATKKKAAIKAATKTETKKIFKLYVVLGSILFNDICMTDNRIHSYDG